MTKRRRRQSAQFERTVAAVRVCRFLASTAGWGNAYSACLFPDCTCRGRCVAMALAEAAEGRGGDPFAGFPEEGQP